MIRVRAAVREDIPTLERILSETFLADHARYIPEPVNPASVRSFSAHLVARRWEAMALGLLNGEPVGMLYVEGAKIEALNVLPPFQRRGVGSALMEWFEARLIRDGAAEATLETQQANLPARAFYEARGYGVARHWLQTAFTRTPIPSVTMSKRLS